MEPSETSVTPSRILNLLPAHSELCEFFILRPFRRLGVSAVALGGQGSQQASRFGRYRDATCGACPYQCTGLDCVRGLATAIKLGW